ncbi:DUF411 domain-containing protein [Ruegeria profundi]|uniref:DUF411 domain-containing protein n=1 Tax=Ruegeria profundi TaxID=1685378 RepID=UPI001CD76F3C|nr:DUF411 domain-containing protein [Ruegeria profundi]MCA0930705.1 CopG family transcriptional regulator [Ruegeria profundi]
MIKTSRTLGRAAVGVLMLSFLTMTWTGYTHADDTTALTDYGKMHVVKSPTCGCCGAWVSLAREEGFEVEVTDTADVTSAKLEGGVPGNMWACHTATIDGYVVEGHVPFEAIRKLLSERPNVKGIAVPGMPYGSPGMGTDPTVRYDVFAFGGEASDNQVYYSVGQ